MDMKNVEYSITCSVFKDELSALLPCDPKTTINTLNCRIHDNPNLMKEELMTAISRANKIVADICILLD